MKHVVWAVLLLSALFLLTTGGTYPGIASVDAHILGQVIAYVVLGGWFIVALVRPEWRPSTPLLLPIALATGAYLLSFALSQRPRLSLEPTIAGVGWAFGYLFISRLLREPWFRTRVRAVLIAFTALVAVGYIVQVVIEWIQWWNLIGFLAVPPLRPSFVGLWLGSPNLVATALLLTGPLAAALVAEQPRRRPLAFALAAVILIAIFLSGSRGAWLGVGFGLLVGLLLALYQRGPRILLRDMVATLQRRPLLLAPIGLAVLGGIALVPAALRRFAVGGEDLRFDLWRSALTIFYEHPLTGGGPGTWAQLKVAANPPDVPNLTLPHAHNLYVQAGAEIGLVGALALAILVAAVAVRLIGDWRAGTDAVSLQSAAVFMALVAFAGQSFVDNVVNLPFVCVLLASIVAWVDAGHKRRGFSLAGAAPNPPGGRARRRPILPAIGILGLALIAPILLRIDAAAVEADLGSRAAQSGDWEEALDHVATARSLDPDFTLYALQQASVLAHVGRIRESALVLGEATDKDPVAINQIGLATLESWLGNSQAGLRHARDAVAAGWGEVIVSLNAGFIAESSADLEFALDSFAAAVARHPPLAASEVWDRPERRISKSAIIAAARQRSEPLEAALILSYGGDPDGARAELESLPPSNRRDIYLAAATWLRGEPAEALDALARILRAHPLDGLAAAWASKIASRSGQPAAAERYRSWSMTVDIGQRGAIVDHAEVGSQATLAAGLPVSYPWSVYLRPLPAYLPVPQLIFVGDSQAGQ